MYEKGQLLNAYQWDATGYLQGLTMWQADENGVLLKTDNATLVAPWGDGEPDDTVFYKWDGSAWQTEKKPTTPEELVGIRISHEADTAHDLELLALIQHFGELEDWHIARGENMDWAIEKTPEKTEEEKLEEEMKKALEEEDKRMEDLKDRALLAILSDDKEAVARLSKEYKDLVGENDEQ